MAMDYAFSRCPTECLLATHVDVFPKHRGLVDKFLARCTPATPVVGWEMSPRGDGPRGLTHGTLSDGIPGHALTIFHIPTMDRIGAGWSIRRGHHVFGLSRGPTPTPGWPDTEVCLGKILEAHGVPSRFMGRETNAEIQETDDWLHARSSTVKLLAYHKLHARPAIAFQQALARIRNWERDQEQGVRPDLASSCDSDRDAGRQSVLSQAAGETSELTTSYCVARRELVPGENAFFCAHPQVNALNQVVRHEVCRICSLRQQTPLFPLRRSPMFVRPSRQPGRVQTIAVIILSRGAASALRETLASLAAQTGRADEILVVQHIPPGARMQTDRTNPVHGDGPQVSPAVTEAGENADLLAPVAARLVSTEIVTPLAAWHLARHETGADVLCFLEAGDCLGRDYIRQGMEALDDPRVGIVYSDVCFGGNAESRSLFPSVCDRPLAARQDLIHRGSLIRRAALESNVRDTFLLTADGSAADTQAARSRRRQAPHDRERAVWWRLCRQILAEGWQARKQAALFDCSPSTETGRIHGSRRILQDDFYTRAGLAAETVSLVVCLTDTRNWPAISRFLVGQSWPHRQIRLTICPTFPDDEFMATVRCRLAHSDYTDIRAVDLFQADEQAPAKISATDRGWDGRTSRRQRDRALVTIGAAQARILNRVVRESAADYLWLLDDDLIPPLCACEQLLRGFDEESALVSAGFWFSSGRNFIAWQQGLDILAGPGFGCTIGRGHVLRDSVLAAGRSTDDFFQFHAGGLRPKLDWSLRIQEQAPEPGTVTV